MHFPLAIQRYINKKKLNLLCQVKKNYTIFSIVSKVLLHLANLINFISI